MCGPLQESGPLLVVERKSAGNIQTRVGCCESLSIRRRAQVTVYKCWKGNFCGPNERSRGLSLSKGRGGNKGKMTRREEKVGRNSRHSIGKRVDEMKGHTQE